MTKLIGLSDSTKKFVATIPKKYIVEAGNILGTLAYMLDARHRRIVRRNLKFTHPNWPENRIRKLTLRIFQNMGITVLEICQMTCFSKKRYS